MFFNHAEGEFGGINRNIRTEFWQKVTAGADVVEVSVGEKDGFHVFLVFFEIFDVGNHIVHARVIVAREEGAHVDDDDFVFVFDQGHVFTDAGFADAAHRDDADGIFGGFRAFQVGALDLVATVAVVAGFVGGNTYDVLGSLLVDILRQHSLVLDHFAAGGGDGELRSGTLRSCLSLFRGVFGVFGGFVIFAAGFEIGIEIARLELGKIFQSFLALFVFLF